MVVAGNSGMSKHDILNHLRDAKSRHLGWVKRVHSLLQGKPVNEGRVAIDPTCCDFGKWYYGEGRHLERVPGYAEIEQPHRRLHELYSRIREELGEKTHPSLWQRLSGHSSREQQRHHRRATQLFSELQHQSDLIVRHLDAMEKHIKQEPEQALRAAGGNRRQQPVLEINGKPIE
jgi:hypothetical protein